MFSSFARARLLALGLALLGLLPAPAGAAQRVFLELLRDGGSVGGGSSDPLYAGWLDVVAFSHGTNFVPDPKPQPGPSVPPLSLLRRPDAFSARALRLLTENAYPLTAHLVIVSGAPDRVELWDVRATNAFLSRQGFEKSSDTSELLESLTFQCGGVEVSYIEVGADGRALQEIFSHYDFLAGQGSSGIRPPMFVGGTDTDGDGIPDGWEFFYGLDPFNDDAGADPDGDGMTNLQEYLAGTDPKRANSVLKVTQVLSIPGQAMTQLTWNSEPGKTYVVESSPNLSIGVFGPVLTVPSGGSTTTALVPFAAPLKTLYRVRIGSP